MARWQKIPPSRFEDLHKIFQGDSPSIFGVCAKCGGKCEYSKISSLLPGEAEYMASSLGMQPEKFRDKFLDRIQIEDAFFDVLKLADPCPFLGEDYECGCRQCKVVLCEMYPIVFEVHSGKVRYFLDEWCPLAREPEYESYFANTGIRAVKDMHIPSDWLEFVAQYDELYFDYSALEKERRSQGIPIEVCATFALETLLRFQLAGGRERILADYAPPYAEKHACQEADRVILSFS